MKKLQAWLATILLVAGLGLVAPSTATAAPSTTTAVPSAAPFCGITWGSLPKTSSTKYVPVVTNVRAGRHRCFDRLVIDLKGKRPGYDVRYGAVYTEGQGARVHLRGTDMRITIKAPAYNSKGQATYTPRNRSNIVNVSNFDTFRQVAWAGSFEGQTTIGLGVRARLPFRVFTLAGPGPNQTMLVIDVARRW
ncbi:hypothetical protein NCCP1664_20780 [Zafaria cholistanensis]|uniref:AMIN-like domain-containing protein n=1 Tax=Zafaria cholistanensis TaxID=1682741 RepID=A0A5A7NRV0_9MICC|nr:hypothetical protein [Zafaria cholistanensis]GER23583.1 hypothetical protein NCCP1664_20780 [Zafaria cholistanensis]